MCKYTHTYVSILQWIKYGVCEEYVRVLSKATFYLPQDGCILSIDVQHIHVYKQYMIRMTALAIKGFGSSRLQFRGAESQGCFAYKECACSYVCVHFPCPPRTCLCAESAQRPGLGAWFNIQASINLQRLGRAAVSLLNYPEGPDIKLLRT